MRCNDGLPAIARSFHPAAAHWTIRLVAILCARAAYGPTGPEPLWLNKDPTTGRTQLRPWTHHAQLDEDDHIEADVSYDLNATIDRDVMSWTTSTETTSASDTKALFLGSPGIASVPTMILSANGAMLSLLLMALSTARPSPKKRRPSKESLRMVDERLHQHLHGVDKAERRHNSGTRMRASCLKKKTPMGSGQR